MRYNEYEERKYTGKTMIIVPKDDPLQLGSPRKIHQTPFLLPVSPFLFSLFLFSFSSKPCLYLVPSAAQKLPHQSPFTAPKTALPIMSSGSGKKVGKINKSKENSLSPGGLQRYSFGRKEDTQGSETQLGSWRELELSRGS